MGFPVKNDGNKKQANEGGFVLENKHGETVRVFALPGSGDLVVAYRLDQRRVEVCASKEELDEAEIPYVLLSETTVADLKKKPLEIKNSGRIRFVEEFGATVEDKELEESETLPPKKLIGYSVCLQLSLAGVLLIATALTGKGSGQKPQETTVTLLPQATVDQMIKSNIATTERQEQLVASAMEEAVQKVEVVQQPPRKIVVAPSLKRISKKTPVPTHSTSMNPRAARVSKKGLRGGGFKGEGRRGYGTNEPNMNEIGALGALSDGPRVKGGNGGRGGLNLQAVGSEPGSGAGGQGHGGFGSNGAGGRGRGGLGNGPGQGLSNSMYGKGLIAAPFGDGGAAPGSGGYGTRGKAGGGAQGAGYGTSTVVGSWKGTGPKGTGPAGSGVGNGNPYGSPYGLVDGDVDDMVVTGGLDMDQIAEVIARNMGQITYCYEQGLQKQPLLTGRVSVKFQIGPRGMVEVARVSHSSVRSAQVEGCIVGKLKNWKFPKPLGGVTVAVTKPFVLRRVAQR